MNRRAVGYIFIVTGILLLVYVADALYVSRMHDVERSDFASIALPLAAICIVVGGFLYRLR